MSEIYDTVVTVLVSWGTGFAFGLAWHHWTKVEK